MYFPNYYAPCNILFEEFIEAYENIPYDSGMCYKLWKLVKEYEVGRDLMKKLINENFSLLEVKFFPPDFLKNREQEQKMYLQKGKRLYTALLNSTHFIKEFKSLREFDVKTKQVRKKLDKERKENASIAVFFKNALKEWKNHLQIDFGKNRPKESSKLSKLIEEEMVTVCQNYGYRMGSVNKIKTLIKLSAYEVQTTQVGRLEKQIEVVDDIQNCLQHEALGGYLEQAKDKLRAHLHGSNRSRVTDAHTLSFESVSTEEKEIEQSMQERARKKINQLGPFGVSPVPDHVMAKHFMPDIGNEILSFNYSEGKDDKKVTALTCPLSLNSNITITDADTRVMISLPTTATDYFFIYPAEQTKHGEDIMQTIGHLGDGDDWNSARNLLRYGGYLYINAAKKMVRLTGLSPVGSSMYFSRPKPFPDSDKINSFNSAGRFKPVTIEKYTKLGAKEFAWIRPGELGNRNHGCFMFKNKDERGFFYVYFEIVTAEIGKRLQALNKTGATGRQTEYSLKQMLDEFSKSLVKNISEKDKSLSRRNQSGRHNQSGRR